MFFDLSVQLQWIASEDTGGIRRTVDKLNTEQKQVENIKKKKKEGGKDIKYYFIKNFLQLSACTTIIRDTLCYKKIVFSPTKIPCNKSQV